MDSKTPNEIRDRFSVLLGREVKDDEKVQDVIAETQTVSDSNVKLQTMDEGLRALESDPEKQLAIAILLCVLCVRRFCTGHALFDRGRRLRVIKVAVGDFERKLRRHVANPQAPALTNH